MSRKLIHRGKFVVLSSPSGGGKTTICERVCKELPFAERSITCTTRPRRPGERHGRDYLFLSRTEFLARKRRGGFIETAEVYGELYGTPRQIASKIVTARRYCVLALDGVGAHSVKRLYKDDAILIFILPPTLETLKHRLTRRATESKNEILRRHKAALSEMKAAIRFDYWVENRSLEQASREVSSILIAERLRTDNIENVKDLHRWHESP